jgi:hypothetical protein
VLNDADKQVQFCTGSISLYDVWGNIWLWLTVCHGKSPFF